MLGSGAGDGCGDAPGIEGGGVITRSKVEAQDLQMCLYAHAARQIYGVERVELQFHSLVKTKTAKVVVQPLVPQDVDAALETVVSTVTHVNLALELEKPEVLMYRRLSWRCAGCGYRGRCQ